MARLAVVRSPILLHVDKLRKVVERIKRVCVCDVVHEQEGIGEKVGGGPKAPVFFLAGGVGEEEEVGSTVDCARDGVGVLCRELERSYIT